MPPVVQTYLQAERIGVLAVEMNDGSPHAATVHVAYHAETNTFIFETNRQYRKVERILQEGATRASIVLGFTEGKESKTFQADGEIRAVTSEEEHFVETYLNKFEEKYAEAKDPNNIFLLLTPTWWRFSDYSHPGGKRIYTSTDSKQ